MRRTKVRVASSLAVAGLVMAGYLIGGNGTLLPMAQAADGTSAEQIQRAFDEASGSGSAGIDPERAEAITKAAEDNLTGDITFSVPSGTFQNSVSVGLTTTIADAQIRYTTNGSLPTSSSTLYSGSPVSITRTTQLRAQAFVSGTPTGNVGTALYVARAISATGNLPMVVMDAYGGGKPNKTAYKDVSIMVMDTAGGSASLANTPAMTTRGGFRLRGQSSSNFEKAPYKLELWDNEGKDADYPVLGMPADSDWVLRGPYPDKSLIRDALAYSLGRDMGLLAPRFAFVELYLNLDAQPMASNDYQGVYMLQENIKRSPDRVPISKLKKTDLTEPAISGGYIMQINVQAADPPLLNCTGNPCWSGISLADPEDATTEQVNWITSYVQKFHNALHSANPSNPTTGYPAYLDVGSWVDRIIHNELAREADSYIRSTHFYKDRGGKLVAGPLWDYDLGYASFTGMGGSTVQGWQYNPGFAMGGADWFQKLMADATFVNQVKARWQALRRTVLSDAQMTAKINALSTPLAAAAVRNFQRWPILNTSMVGGFQTQTTQTWDQQIQIVRTFVTQRAAWLDSTSNWGGSVQPTNPPTVQPTVQPTTSPTVQPTNPPVGRGCTATYAVTNQWQGGFQAEVKVTAGASAISGWTVTWTFSNGQTVTQAWNATVTSSGASVTARNAAYNGALSAGGSTTFGLTGNWNGSNTAPAVSCTAS